MSGLNTAINTFGSYWSPCDLRHASPRISATTAPMTCASQVQRPHMALALKALKPWRPSRSSYCFRYIYIYIDGCWCLLMLIDVWTFWMMLIPFFDLWINLYHRSIFSRIVAFSMDKEQRRQNHSGPCMCPPWQCFRCPGNPGAPLETERLLKPGWWVVRAY